MSIGSAFSKTWLNNVFRVLTYILFFAAAICLILWPFSEAAKRVDQHLLLGVAVSVLGVFIVYFDGQLRDILSLSEILDNAGLNDIFGRVLRKKKHVGHLRIFALTTRAMFSAVQQDHVCVDVCEILLYSYPAKPDVDGPPAASQRCHENAKRWAALQASGQIKQLKVVSYPTLPTSFLILVDDDTAISGRYYPCDDGLDGCGHTDPIFYTTQHKSGATAIHKDTLWFDKTFEYYSGLGSVCDPFRAKLLQS